MGGAEAAGITVGGAEVCVLCVHLPCDGVILCVCPQVMEGAAAKNGRLWCAAQERGVWCPHWSHEGPQVPTG